ncbi:protein phosphatase 1 regulatory subunit 12C-like [Larimichthys crocea]|uniref:protein phosphatase 1 regulatory subunit 12C-like n=1 Tax=Larimichthys crocea TaxID=215358 RepID=UPI000F5E4B28|nr:protein phosphatase 1 regulatory subunit 12C-like [Larimichthys crocea]
MFICVYLLTIVVAVTEQFFCLWQSQESSTDRPALLELDRFEKLALQRKAVELEDELKVLGDLRADNQRLKDENAALIRVISKLSR